MAIAITRGLQSLVSVFNQQSIEFTVPNGTTGVQCTISGVAFTPVRTSTVTVDTYVMDLTEILRYVLGFPNGTDLSASCTISISATGQTTVTTTGMLVYGYDQIQVDTDYVLNEYVRLYGARGVIYNNGTITFYFSGTTGSYTGVLNGHSQAFTLSTGYNTIVLPTQWRVAGMLVFTGTDLELSLYYRNSDTYEIKWIDEDGRFSRWNFRKISTTNEQKKSNTVPSYYQTQALTTEKSVDISAEKNVMFVYDTIAVNEDHYQQLIKIQDSLFVQVQGVRMKVRSSDSTVAECRQNLHFTITLEQEQYVPTY